MDEKVKLEWGRKLTGDLLEKVAEGRKRRAYRACFPYTLQVS